MATIKQVINEAVEKSKEVYDKGKIAVKQDNIHYISILRLNISINQYSYFILNTTISALSNQM